MDVTSGATQSGGHRCCQTVGGFLIMHTQIRTMWTVFKHLFDRTDTVQYPEEKPYLAPRYRGRIVLTRDPDGEERCVACNLCAVACPVDCISLQKTEDDHGRWRADFFRINFLPHYFHVRINFVNINFWVRELI